MTKILYCEGNRDGTVGGSYHSLALLVGALGREKYLPTVVFYHENFVAGRLRESGVDVRIWPSPPGESWLWTSAFLKRFRRARALLWFLLQVVAPAMPQALFLRRGRFGLVHLNNGVQSNTSWMLAARLAGIPCVTHERVMDGRLSFPTRQFLPFLSKIVCISEAVRANLLEQGFPPGKLALVYNGIDTDSLKLAADPGDLRHSLGLDPEHRVMVMAGNLKEWKGQHVVMEAMAEVVKHFPSAVCLFIGGVSSGSEGYAARLRGMAEHLHLGEAVRFLGEQRQVLDYMNAAELVIHASTEPEPFGRVIIEAMALAKPVIASASGGAAEIVVDGETGILVEPGNPGALARAIVRLLGDRDFAARAGETGRQRVRSTFHSASTASGVEAVYREILQTGRP